MRDTDLLAGAADPGTVFRADCPSRPILDQIADKWSLMVMAVLARPTRFNELKRRLEGVTQRVLTQMREPFGHLYAWTVEHSPEIQRAQQVYDHGTGR